MDTTDATNHTPRGPANRADDWNASIDHPLRYVAIGDSIARGFQTTWPRPWRRDGCGVRVAGIPLRWFDDVAGAYPVEAARLLTDLLGRRIALDMRLTCSGTRTDHLWRDGPTNLLRSGFDEPADLVTVSLGANDLIPLWYRYIAAVAVSRPVRTVVSRTVQRSVRDRFAPPAHGSDEAARQMEHRLRSILKWICERSPAARIIVTTYHLADAADATDGGFCRPLVHAIGAAVDGCPAASLIDLRSVLSQHDPGERTISRLDGFHPTRAGQRRIAHAVARDVSRRMSAPLVGAVVARG